MEWVYLVAGIFLVLLAGLDALWTTLWVDGGAGPISRRLLGAVQRLLPKGRRDRHIGLSLAGPISIVLMVATWVALAWTGWTLVFLADPDAVVGSPAGDPAGLGDTVYFVGYSLFTMGNGDFVPTTTAAQIATDLAAVSGLALVTLAFTYTITVLAAVVNQRALANMVLGVARRPQDIPLTSWNRGRFEGMERMLGNVTDTITRTTEQHLAYPVLHAFHASRPERSVSVALAVLDEALTMLRHGVRPEHRPESLPMHAAQAAIANYLSTLRDQHFDAADSDPPAPTLDALRAAGIPVVEEAEFQEAIEGLRERRRLLLGKIRTDHWVWEDVTLAEANDLQE